MKRRIFKMLGKMNSLILPNYTKKKLDLQKADKFEKAIIGWKLWVTKNSLG